MTVCNRCLLDDLMTWCEECEKSVCASCDRDDLNACEATGNLICANCRADHACGACRFAARRDEAIQAGFDGGRK